MPSVKYSCPECDAVLRLAEDAISSRKSVRCPECGASFRPRPGRDEEDEPAPKPRKKSPARDKEDDTDAPPRRNGAGAGRAARRGSGGDFDFEDAEEDEPRPRKGRGEKAPAKKDFPLWLPISGGVAALAAVVLIVVFASGKGDRDKRPVAQGPPAPGRQADPEPPALPDRPDPEPPARPVRPANDERVARIPDPGPGKLPPIELPPLPPEKDRPTLVLDPNGHTAFVKRVLFTPDGKQVVTASMDKSVRVWDLETGETVRTFRLPNGPGDEGGLYAAALSPDGKKLAVGGMPFGRGKFGVLVYEMSMETGRVERTFKGHRGVLTSLAYSPDGRWLASTSEDGTAIVYKLENGLVAAHLKGHKERVQRIAFHPRDGRIATCSLDKTVRIWMPENGGLKPKELSGHTLAVNCIAWSPDGETLASGGVDGTIRLWTKDGAFVKEYPKVVEPGSKSIHTQFTALEFTQDAKELMFAGVAYAGKAGVFNLETGKRRLDLPFHSNSVQHGSISPDRTLAATTGGDANETVVWRVSDGSVVQRIVGAGRSVWAVAWGKDGKTIHWGNTNRGSLIPPRMPLEQTFRLEALDFGKPPEGEVLRAQLSAGGTTFRQADFFNLEISHRGGPPFAFKTPLERERIYSATLLDADRLVVGGSDALYLVDLKRKKVVREYAGHSGMVTAVAPSPDGRFFATGCADQTIRIWSPERESPVLSLFFAGRDWIAWVPEGYYAASPGGERLMGWQVNNGHDKEGTYYPAIQFRQSLYQPEVIKNLFKAGGDLRGALALAARERNRPIAAVNLMQVMPPAVAITAPVAAGAFRTDKDTIEVKATARSAGNHPVRALRLLLDGRPYDGDRGVRAIANPRPGEAEAKWTVALPPGRHTLVVQADSGVSKGLSAPVEVTRAGEVRLPNLYVFAAGVSQYPGRMRLNYAASDAQTITHVLKEKTKGVFGKVEVRLVTDREATKAAILQGLDWLGEQMTAQDVGIFFFSGHGAKDDEDAFYLVPVDVRLRDMTGSCVPGDVVKRKLANMPGRLVAMFDACHSGAAADSFRAGQADELLRDLVTDDYGVVVMCSSMGEEVSIESTETKAGFFTAGLVEALGGRADFNRDGLVHIHEANFYAMNRVRELSRGTQNPVLGRSPGIRPFPLTKP